MSKIKELEQLLTPLLEKELVELVDLQYVSEAGNKVLRLFVDKEGGIKLSDCEYLSNKVGECLDAANLIPDSYVLEVSSPGLDRILKNEKDFVKFLGKKARVTTYVPVNGQKNFLGLLKLVLASPDIESAREQLKLVLSILRKRHPKAADVLEGAGEDFIAFMHFPGAHWRKLHSTNLVERLNRELKRRTRVVSIFPTETSLKNLIGAVLERFYLAWAGERYISADSMRQLDDPLAAVRGDLTSSDAA